jgi:hypothetical protein
MPTTLSTGAEVVYDDAVRGKLSEVDRQIDVSVRSLVDGRAVGDCAVSRLQKVRWT